jgi:hypothetical protein
MRLISIAEIWHQKMSIYFAYRMARYASATSMKLRRQVSMSLFTLQLVFAMITKVRSSSTMIQKTLAKQNNVEHYIHANQSLKPRNNIIRGLKTGVLLCHIYQK